MRMRWCVKLRGERALVGRRLKKMDGDVTEKQKKITVGGRRYIR